ncbi:hypothetical protein [Robertkochia solimangrovi]|uniref:hypothetical protein n=1 Tax=Robertkochia solimangrovi TaxID=2213046 RepID=UPI00117D9535|nr:hypothetical protein [Robertkochia solimangrovi]TRZ45296.1 hypothetical protein DMZ48_06000 [Robertkochia solimangrovi]
MNQSVRFFVIVISLTLFACSDSDDGSTPETPEPKGDYFPLSVNNYWTYDVEANEPGIDSLYISKDSTINNLSYAKFEARDPDYGYFTRVLNTNFVRTEDDKAYLYGELKGIIPYVEESSIMLDNVVLYDMEMEIGDVMYESEGTTSGEYDGNTIEMEYKVTTVLENIYSSYTVNNVAYADVMQSRMTLTAKAAVVTIVNGVPVTLPVMTEQEIADVSLFFAPEVGMIRSDADISWELVNTELVDPNLSSSYSETSSQTLIGYMVAPD